MDESSESTPIPQSLKTPDVSLAKTIHKEIFAYAEPKRVIKVRKSGQEDQKNFKSVDDALADIKKTGLARELIRSHVASLNADLVDSVASTSAVVHQSSDQDSVAYTESQHWYQGAKPLSEVSVLKLKKESLKLLKDVFQANLNLWNKEGKLIDIPGSNISHQSIWNRSFKRILPLFYSENIIIDQQGIPRMIDIEGIELKNASTIKKVISQNLRVVGYKLSIYLINLLVAAKFRS